MMNDHDRYFVLILIVISPIIGAGCSVSYSQDEIAVLVGTGGLIDGNHVNYVTDLKAVWNATSFAMYDNGTITADLKFIYLSDNPTSSSIYNTTTHRTESVATNGDLKYLSSIALMKVVGEYYNSQFGTGTSPSLSKLIPVTTLELDNQTSLASFRAGYNTSAEYLICFPALFSSNPIERGKYVFSTSYMTSYRL